MARTALIAGNWKMFKTITEAVELVEGLKKGLEKSNGREVLVCPPFTALLNVRDAIGGAPIKLGSQNLYYEPEGPYTGEVSAAMLLDVGAEYVIIGHSERRSHFNEDDELVNKKVKAALDAGLKPILCVGETLSEREEGASGYEFETTLGPKTKIKLNFEVGQSWQEVLKRQIETGTRGLSEKEACNLTVAYEPVWAIGTGRTATPEIASKTHKSIRLNLTDTFGVDIAKKIRILYGGSVKPENAGELMSEREIDGVLVGGASLKAETFLPIIHYGA
jgi:triosephosphate isomerase